MSEGDVGRDRKSWLSIPDGGGECPWRTSSEVRSTLRTGRTVLVRGDPVRTLKDQGIQTGSRQGRPSRRRESRSLEHRAPWGSVPSSPQTFRLTSRGRICQSRLSAFFTSGHTFKK